MYNTADHLAWGRGGTPGALSSLLLGPEARRWEGLRGQLGPHLAAAGQGHVHPRAWGFRSADVPGTLPHTRQHCGCPSGLSPAPVWSVWFSSAATVPPGHPHHPPTSRERLGGMIITPSARTVWRLSGSRESQATPRQLGPSQAGCRQTRPSAGSAPWQLWAPARPSLPPALGPFLSDGTVALALRWP